MLENIFIRFKIIAILILLIANIIEHKSIKQNKPIVKEDNNVQVEKVNKNVSNNSKIVTNEVKKNIFFYNKEIIGRIIIPKIDINHNLFSIESRYNNINKNITILKESKFPNNKNTSLFLAAHSNGGPLAYFKNLDKLNIGDKIIFQYQNKNYIYIVQEIYEDEKNGMIYVKKTNTNQIILTTCSKKNNQKQLIVNAILKEIN